MSRALAALALAALSVPLSGQPAPAPAPQPAKPLVPTIKEIMQRSHRCSNAYIRDVEDELDKKESDWTVVAARARELVRVGKLLALNTPPKGSKESWEKLTTLYTARATVLVDAAERKDKEEATLQTERFFGLCRTCHQAHR